MSIRYVYLVTSHSTHLLISSWIDLLPYHVAFVIEITI